MHRPAVVVTVQSASEVSRLASIIAEVDHVVLELSHVFKLRKRSIGGLDCGIIYF